MIKPKSETSDDSVVLRVELDVRVYPNQMRPYSTIEHLNPLDRAIRLVQEKCTGDLLWVDGVDDIERIRTYALAETLQLSDATEKRIIETMSPESAHDKPTRKVRHTPKVATSKIRKRR